MMGNKWVFGMEKQKKISLYLFEYFKRISIK
jgi:hypothetical protein